MPLCTLKPTFEIRKVTLTIGINNKRSLPQYYNNTSVILPTYGLLRSLRKQPSLEEIKFKVVNIYGKSLYRLDCMPILLSIVCSVVFSVKA